MLIYRVILQGKSNVFLSLVEVDFLRRVEGPSVYPELHFTKDLGRVFGVFF